MGWRGNGKLVIPESSIIFPSRFREAVAASRKYIERFADGFPELDLQDEEGEKMWNFRSPGVIHSIGFLIWFSTELDSSLHNGHVELREQGWAFHRNWISWFLMDLGFVLQRNG